MPLQSAESAALVRGVWWQASLDDRPSASGDQVSEPSWRPAHWAVQALAPGRLSIAQRPSLARRILEACRTAGYGPGRPLTIKQACEWCGRCRLGASRPDSFGSDWNSLSHAHKRWLIREISLGPGQQSEELPEEELAGSDGEPTGALPSRWQPADQQRLKLGLTDSQPTNLAPPPENTRALPTPDKSKDRKEALAVHRVVQQRRVAPKVLAPVDSSAVSAQLLAQAGERLKTGPNAQIQQAHHTMAAELRAVREQNDSIRRQLVAAKKAIETERSLALKAQVMLERERDGLRVQLTNVRTQHMALNGSVALELHSTDRLTLDEWQPTTPTDALGQALQQAEMMCLGMEELEVGQEQVTEQERESIAKQEHCYQPRLPSWYAKQMRRGIGLELLESLAEAIALEDEFWLSDLIALGVLDLLVTNLEQIDQLADDGQDDEQDAALLVGLVMCLYELATLSDQALSYLRDPIHASAVEALVHSCRVLLIQEHEAHEQEGPIEQAELSRYVLLLLCVISSDDVDGHASVSTAFKKFADEEDQPHYYRLVKHLEANPGRNLASKCACIQLINCLIAPGQDRPILMLEQRLVSRAEFEQLELAVVFGQMIQLHLGSPPELYLKLLARISRYHKQAQADMDLLSKQLSIQGLDKMPLKSVSQVAVLTRELKEELRDLDHNNIDPAMQQAWADATLRQERRSRFALMLKLAAARGPDSIKRSEEESTGGMVAGLMAANKELAEASSSMKAKIATLQLEVTEAAKKAKDTTEVEKLKQELEDTKNRLNVMSVKNSHMQGIADEAQKQMESIKRGDEGDLHAGEKDWSLPPGSLENQDKLTLHTIDVNLRDLRVSQEKSLQQWEQEQKTKIAAFIEKQRRRDEEARTAAVKLRDKYADRIKNKIQPGGEENDEEWSDGNDGKGKGKGKGPPVEAAKLEGKGRAPQVEAAKLEGKGRAPQVEAAKLEGKGRAPQVEAAKLEGKGRAPQVEAAKLEGKGRAPQVGGGGMNAVVGKDPNSMWPDSIYGMKKLDWIRSVLIGGAPSKSLWLVDVLGQSPQQIQDTVVKILCESNLFISAFEIKRPKPKPPVEPKLPSAINFFKEANKREFSLLPKAKAEEKLSKMWSDCDDKALYEAKLAQAMPKYEASLKKFKQDMKEYVKLYGEVKQAHLSKNNASSGGVAKNSRGESLDEARLKEVEIIMATYNMQRKKEAKLAGRPKGRMSAFEQEREYDAIVMELRDKILEMDTSVMTKDLALQQIKKLGPQCPRNAEDSVPDETMKLNHAWPGWKIYGGRGVDPLLTKASGEMILDEKLGERPIFQERAVYVMSTIPALRIRCELQETMLECQENVTSLRERVDVIQLCLRELRGADKLAYFLKISLSIGNFLNAQKDALGRFPAPRDGLNISGFTAFAELKSNDRRWALSDFAVMFYRQLRPEDLRFYEELLPKVHSARAINPIKLDQDIDKLHKGVKSVEEALKTIDKCYEVPGVVDQFHAAIQSEIEELRLKDFEKQQLDMMDQFESVAQYYCVDPFHFSFTESPMQIMFDDILSVLESDGMYIQALGKLEMREKMEERKRLKAQQKAREAEAKKHAVSAKQGARSVGKGNDRSKTQVALPSRSEFNNEFQDMLKGRRNLKRNQGI